MQKLSKTTSLPFQRWPVWETHIAITKTTWPEIYAGLGMELIKSDMTANNKRTENSFGIPSYYSR